MHRGFGGVWFARAEHPGRVGQFSHGGDKKGHFPLVSDYQAVKSQVELTPKVMTDLMRGLDCNVWVDDVFYLVEDEISLLCLLDDSWPVGECWFVRRCSQVHLCRSRIGLVWKRVFRW